MSVVFERTLFNLNMLTIENDDKSNLRFFEVPSSGGLLLTERNEISIQYLEDVAECFMYSSIGEIKNILVSDVNLNEIARLGQKRILKDCHKFSDRVSALLDNIEIIL